MLNVAMLQFPSDVCTWTETRAEGVNFSLSPKNRCCISPPHSAVTDSLFSLNHFYNLRDLDFSCENPYKKLKCNIENLKKTK